MYSQVQFDLHAKILVPAASHMPYWYEVQGLGLLYMASYCLRCCKVRITHEVLVLFCHLAGLADCTHLRLHVPLTLSIGYCTMHTKKFALGRCLCNNMTKLPDNG